MRFEFIIPAQFGIDDLKTRLQETISLKTEPPHTLRRRYYDSFDWRVFTSNSVLEADDDGKSHRLVWRALNGDRMLAQTTLAKPPRFAWDIPAGQLRDRLEPVLEMRELVPLVTITSKTHNLRALNRDEKTIARVIIGEHSVRRNRGKAIRLDNRITVLPVKGYKKPFDKIVATLQSLGLEPATDDPMLAALAATGISPGGYSSKLNLHLDPGERADRASRTIFRRLLDIIRENEAGTRQGTDTEFLHDFRVSVRRTRSALTQIKWVLPLPVLNRYKTEFAWLGPITGPTRDLDVYLLKFDDYKNSLPVSAQADIEPLRDFLIRHHAIEQKALVKALDSARYRRLLQSWAEFLEKPVNERSTLANARRPVREVACQRIWKVYRGILKEGRAIQADTPAEALHELRKTGKKLRYLMEFFQSLFPAKKIKELIRVLKTLQDNLGDFQDYEVQVATLKQFGQQMVTEEAAPAETLLAMGMLIDGLERRQHLAREEFAERFAGFDTAENRDHFRQLFTDCGTDKQDPTK
jgi:CHAD domain-containing protein